MSQKKQMNRIALDLEMWADEGVDEKGNKISKVEDIIQIGFTIFDPQTNDILEKGGWYVKIHKPLTPYIINLTGITQEDLNTKGISFIDAYKNLCDVSNKHKCFKQLVTWGAGDLEQIRAEHDVYHSDCEDYTGQDFDIATHHVVYYKQGNKEPKPYIVPIPVPWIFGRAECNVKAMYQAKCMRNGKRFNGGLEKSMINEALTFIPYEDNIDGKIILREAHNAIADALNTALMYLHLV